ncbi:MAG: NAD(P)/FAD-dependent oxidoreductase [Lactobacillus amylovorus]|jgi:NADH dehydrogenase|uniref:NADH:ubiquinone reductase (non-electrogenic) n=1 Tax=Lactobacillus amylovorus subsp. animalium DSM 16698 TaxID=695563 RepID=A0A0R2KTL2_LACAM|nr:NAD(P)/FAD-dependent oxidoreductase [Lactobacillus amylovorus]KRN92899.1 NADH dehydrogenase, FAD-containing subunit [Lactobacillus amylovorus DSM 16698]
MTQTNIVVIGGGFGGLYTTKHLAKKLKKNKDVKITLIDKHPYMTMMTSLHEVAADRVDPSALKYDLQRLFSRRKHVDVVTDEVTKIDQKSKKVIGKNGEYPYDYAVLAIGSQPNDFGTPGVKEYGFTLGSLDDAERLRDHIDLMVHLGAQERDPERRKQFLNFVIVGTGFTGTEMAGELNSWKPELAKRYNLQPDEIKITMMEMAPTVMNMLDRADADKAEKYLTKHGVDIKVNTGVVGVHDDHIDLKSGDTFPTRTLIWTAGVKAVDSAKDFGFETARAGRIVVNQYSQIPNDPHIYVIGDVAMYDENGSGRGEPQVVQGAESAGKCAFKNILAQINGGEPTKFKGTYSGFMVSLGPSWGVASLVNTFHLSGFFAILMKDLVDMIYFIEIYSGYYLFHYIMNEWFRIKRPTLWRGNLNRYGNVLWTVPLRIFLGMMWLIDCWYKVQGSGSWFSNKLQLHFPWLAQAATSGATSKAAATTAASGKAAAASANAVQFSLNYDYGHSPMAVFDQMPSWVQSMTKAVIPNKAAALNAQKIMTVVEILLGVLLVIGLCTFLAGGMSAAFIAIFCLSGMNYWVNVWMFFAAIAVMNGSGRSFGLDMWFVPWLEKTLGKARYGVLRPIYHVDKNGVKN